MTHEKKARQLKLAGLLALAAFLTLLGKTSAFLRDVILAYCFGVGPSTDAYFIANVIPGLIWAAVAVTTNMVFLPLYVARRSDRADVEHFVNEAIWVYAIAAIVLTIVCGAAAGPIVRFTASGANPATLELARQLTLIMSVGFIFSGYVGLQNAIQQANGRFIAPLTVPVVNNLITAIGIVIGARIGGIRLAIAAAVAGWVLQAPIQRLQTRKFYASRVFVRLRRDTVNRLLLLSAPVMAGVLLDQLNIYVGIYLAGGFGQGAISHLNYGSRLANFIAGLFSWLVAYFLFPRVAAAAGRNDDAALAPTLAIGFGLIGVLTAPMVVVALLMSNEVIATVYGRGAYSAGDVAITALVFASYAYGVVFIAFRELLNRVFFSYQWNYVPLITGVVATVFNLGASYELSSILGVRGIALGAALGAFCYAAIEIGVLFFYRRTLLTRELGLMLAAILVAAVAGYVAGAPIVVALAGLSSFVRLLVGGVSICLVYVIVLLGCLALTGFRADTFMRLWTAGSTTDGDPVAPAAT